LAEGSWANKTITEGYYDPLAWSVREDWPIVSS